MAKRIDIGRSFAAVMNHPEPGPIVLRMARAECSAFYLAVLRRRVMFCQTGRWGNLPPFFFGGYNGSLQHVCAASGLSRNLTILTLENFI